MPLRDITNKSSTGTASGLRQTTLLDTLGGIQQRRKSNNINNKQQYPTTAVSLSHTSANSENRDPSPNSRGVTLKRPYIPPLSPVAAKKAKENVNCVPNLKLQKKQNTGGFGLCSGHSALRYRQINQHTSMRNVSTINSLHSLVSPMSSVHALVAPPSSRQHVLPLACKYSNNTSNARGRLALVDDNGKISIFNALQKQTEDSNSHEGLQPAVEWAGHNHVIFDVEWSSDDTQLVTTSGDETCRLWDAERQILLGSFEGHSQTVKSVSWEHGSPYCFATASRGGSIFGWDTRCNKTKISSEEYSYRPVSVIAGAHHVLRQSKPTSSRHRGGKTKIVEGSVTAIRHLQHNDKLLASVGSTSETVKIWDIRMSSHTTTRLPNQLEQSQVSSLTSRARGTSSLSLDPDGTRLYSACADNSVYVHNALRLGSPIARLTAPEFSCNNFSITTSMHPQGQYLAAGSSSGLVVIWELDRFGNNSSKRRAVLSGHMKETGSVAWYPGQERTQLATCGDDGLLRIWDLDGEMSEQGRGDPMSRCRWGFTSIHEVM